MPKKHTQSQDLSYSSSSPQKYRKYTDKTKTKLCFMVKKLGWSLRSAAKQLKINASTARMILKNFNHGSYEGMQEFFHRNCSQPEQNKTQRDQNKTEQHKSDPNPPLLCYFLYYDITTLNSFPSSNFQTQ